MRPFNASTRLTIRAVEPGLCGHKRSCLPFARLNPARTRAVNGFEVPLPTGQNVAQLLYVDQGSLAADLVISATLDNEVTAVFAGNGSVRLLPTSPAPEPNSADLPPGTSCSIVCAGRF